MASYDTTLTWIRNGVTLLEGQDASVMISQIQVNSTYYNFSLMIPDVQLSHNGTYACHVSNQFSATGPSASDSSSDFYLFVQSK